MEEFREYLKENHLRFTNQRQVILETFLECRDHVSTEEVYGLVKKRDPHIGHATVFRTLKLLCGAGIAKEVDFGDRVMRYECARGRDHHDHLICTQCGKTIEAVDPRIEELQDQLCKKFHFQPLRHQLQIFGLCRHCVEKAGRFDKGGAKRSF